MTGQSDTGENELSPSDHDHGNDSGEGARPSPDARHQASASVKVGIATAVVGLVAAIPAYYAWLAGPDATAPSATALPSASSPEDTPANAPSAPSSSASSDASETSPTRNGTDPDSRNGGEELWRGTLVLESTPKDLDAGQPVEVGYADEGDVFLVGDKIGGWNGTTLSLWSARTTEPPGFEECSETVHAEGSDSQELTTNMVMCVHTSAGNLARLELTEFDTGIDDRAVFDTVIWTTN